MEDKGETKWILSRNLQKKCAHIVKGNVKNGIVVTYYNNLTQAKCVDYVKKEETTKKEKPLTRVARQQKPLMAGMTQIY